MDEYYQSDNKLLTKKNIINLLLLAVIILAIPVAVKLVQTQQQLQSQATTVGGFSFPELRQDSAGNYVTNTPNVKVQLNSPFGPPTPDLQTR